jgi:hypothetical protein
MSWGLKPAIEAAFSVLHSGLRVLSKMMPRIPNKTQDIVVRA